MERLTERTADGILVKENYEKESLKTLYSCYGENPNSYYSNCEEGYCAMEKLADYEDLEEQGRMIIFPCNKGDKLYEFYRECVEDRLGAGETPEDIINVRKVYGFEYEDDVLYIRASYHSNHSELWGGYGEDTPEFPVSEIGKTVFLTYEEAKAKLKEMEEESDVL
jgi:hypothetical protein